MDVAIQLREKGLRFIKVKPRHKAPIEKGWQTDANYYFDDPRLLSHIEQGGNYGIVAGPGDLVIIDIDSKDLEGVLSLLPSTFVVETANGFHYYYKCSDIPRNRSHIQLKVNGNDIGHLKLKNSFVVAPGSIHPSGSTYKVYNFDPIAEVESGDILAALEDIFPKPSKPAPRSYKDRGGKFQASELARDIMHDFIFKTLKDTEEIYYYHEGIYLAGGEALIKEQCEERGGQGLTNHAVNEVIGHIKRRTYVDRSTLQTPPQYLHVQNGVINLETNKRLPFSSDIVSLTKLPTIYDPNASCPKIKDFIAQVVDRSDISTIQELLGYCLYRRYFIHRATMFLGPGSNGKTTLLNLFEAFLGKNNVSHVPLQDLVNNRFAPAKLYNKLGNFFADIESHALFRTGKFKALVGEDSIWADQKFKGGFDFVNCAKMVYSCNQLPVAHDESDAYYRRWLLVNFPNTFEGGKRDPRLLEKLTTPEELSGLLNWAIEGLQRILEKGDFTNAMTTEAVRDLYKRMSDPLQAFIEDWCNTEDSNARTLKKNLYNAYIQYCNERNLPKKSDGTIGKSMKRLGYMDERPKAGPSWVGIAVLDGVLKVLKVQLQINQTTISGVGGSKNNLEKIPENPDIPDRGEVADG